MNRITDKIKFAPLHVSAVFVIGLFFFTSGIFAAQTETILVESRHRTGEIQPNNIQPEGSAGLPDMADIIPLAAELTSRLKILESKFKSGLDIAAIEIKYGEMEAGLNDFSDRLQRLKDSGDYRYTKLMELKEANKQKGDSLAVINKPLNLAIRQLDAWRNEWLIEQKKWKQWQASLVRTEQVGQLQMTFQEADTTIETASNRIRTQLDALLAVQARAGGIQVKINTFAEEIEGLIAGQWHSVLFETSPPMLSLGYISQFSGDLWIAVRRGIDGIAWPNRSFFEQQGWFVFIQGFLSLVAIIALYRNRETLRRFEHWRFLAVRPVSAGLFFFAIPFILFYEYEGAPDIWKLANLIMAGICFIRLSGALAEASWKRQFCCGLVIVYIVTRFLNLIEFPVPLFRLYTVFICLLGLLFCFLWIRKSARLQEPGLTVWLLRLSFLFSAIILIAEFTGKTSLASYLFFSLTLSIATVFAFLLFAYMIRGSIEWLFRTSLLQRASVLYSDTTAIIRRLTHFIDIAIWGLVLLPSILTIWGVYDSLTEATRGLLGLGFQWGSRRITIGLVLTALGIIYGSFLISWIFQKLVMDVLLRSRQIDRGSQHSIKRLTHYTILVIGFLAALSTLGFEATKITILLSALGVGIGFGLQGLVNNLVSGLILLFERPIRVGDTIQLGDNWAEIRRIGLRSTVVRTFEEADLIIPNADLITNQVINWTLTNRLVRLTIPVGVAYGSDVPLVMETLAACAKDRENVVAHPEPQVLFLRFGESSLNFELRVWVKDADYRLDVMSQLHQEIDRVFREKKIEIAFPQLDLHMRSMENSARSQMAEEKRETNKQS